MKQKHNLPSFNSHHRRKVTSLAKSPDGELIKFLITWQNFNVTDLLLYKHVYICKSLCSVLNKDRILHNLWQFLQNVQNNKLLVQSGFSTAANTAISKASKTLNIPVADKILPCSMDVQRVTFDHFNEISIP